jgi:hypothetical protein
MKITTIVFILFSLCLTTTPLVIQAQDKATVTVTITSLTAISTDACNEKMDFYAKINIGGKIKSFPVMEGNNIRPNWQFVTTTDKEIITSMIEIWDDDDALCGGGDDAVSIIGNSNRVRKTLNSMETQSADYTSQGTGNGNEKARITYTISIIPIKTKTQLLTQRSWKKVRVETASETQFRIWKPSLPAPPGNPACKKDDEYVFSFKGSYQKNEGATKCVATSPQVIATGNWVFTANETQIQLSTTESHTPVLYKVAKLDENTLWLVIEEVTGGTTTYTRITYGH